MKYKKHKTSLILVSFLCFGYTQTKAQAKAFDFSNQNNSGLLPVLIKNQNSYELRFLNYTLNGSITIGKGSNNYDFLTLSGNLFTGTKKIAR